MYGHELNWHEMICADYFQCHIPLQEMAETSQCQRCCPSYETTLSSSAKLPSATISDVSTFEVRAAGSNDSTKPTDAGQPLRQNLQKDILMTFFKWRFGSLLELRTRSWEVFNRRILKLHRLGWLVCELEGQTTRRNWLKRKANQMLLYHWLSWTLESRYLANPSVHFSWRWTWIRSMHALDTGASGKKDTVEIDALFGNPPIDTQQHQICSHIQLHKILI